MKSLLAGLVFVATLSGAPAAERYTGTITDDMCANADHSGMRMGPTDAECTMACVDAHGAGFVLWDGTNTYVLSDQRTPKQFAGKKVIVTGTLDAAKKTVQVDSIAAAP